MVSSYQLHALICMQCKGHKVSEYVKISLIYSMAPKKRKRVSLKEGDSDDPLKKKQKTEPEFNPDKPLNTQQETEPDVVEVPSKYCFVVSKEESDFGHAAGRWEAIVKEMQGKKTLLSPSKLLKDVKIINSARRVTKTLVNLQLQTGKSTIGNALVEAKVSFGKQKILKAVQVSFMKRKKVYLLNF